MDIKSIFMILGCTRGLCAVMLQAFDAQVIVAKDGVVVKSDVNHINTLVLKQDLAQGAAPACAYLTLGAGTCSERE